MVRVGALMRMVTVMVRSLQTIAMHAPLIIIKVESSIGTSLLSSGLFEQVAEYCSTSIFHLLLKWEQ